MHNVYIVGVSGKSRNSKAVCWLAEKWVENVNSIVGLDPRIPNGKFKKLKRKKVGRMKDTIQRFQVGIKRRQGEARATKGVKFRPQF